MTFAHIDSPDVDSPLAPAHTPEPAPVRVVVADDEALVRGGLVLLLSSQPQIVVVGEAGDGHAAALACRDLAPDVLVTDLRMPGLDGVALTAAVSALPQPPRVLLVTTFDSDPDVRAALVAGAAGYLLKRSAPAELASAVRRVAAGDVWLDPAVAGHVVTALRATPRPAARRPEVLQRLTARECEVLTLLAHGLSTQELARRLFLGQGTIKTHVSRILHKTASRDRAQAVALAYACGLVTVPAAQD